MRQQFKCRNGHEWSEPIAPTGIAVEISCPVCSTAGIATNSLNSMADRAPDETLVARLDDTSIVGSSTTADKAREDAEGPTSNRDEADQGTAVSCDSPEILLHVPGYEIQSELGQGAMGVVYKARHLQLNRIVALKMLVTAGHGESLARAKTECESVAQLQHPNIIQIFEVHEHNSALFFAFEYVDSGTLAPGGVRSARHAAELMEVIGRAIHYAHEQGVVHRDLKPANILMTSAGVPKIADFGLAKRRETDPNQTQAGSIMGTPHYMSPEQAYGRVSEIGPAADIYSLGTILYELLTGKVPFEDPDILSLLNKVRTAAPVPPGMTGIKVHRDVETICLKCLEKHPRNRYVTAAEFANDLRRFLDGEPIQAVPISNIQRSLRWLKKRAIAVGVTASMLLIVSIVVLFATSSIRNVETNSAARASVSVEQLEGLPAFSVPMNNPLTKGKVELGRQLFFDRRLSVDDSVACVDCHNPATGWADQREFAVGVRQTQGTRNSPPVSNAVYADFLFWDGRSNSLEEQAIMPITNPLEMGMTSLDALAMKIRQIQGYRIQFEQVFENGVTPENIGAALAAFERTLVAGNSPYDRFIKGQTDELSQAAQRGMTVFLNAGHCSACHSGPLFSDGGFHNIGIGKSLETADAGRFHVTGRRGDRGSFKTPSLRDVSRTSPYMHNGSLKTLEDVVQFYAAGGIPGPQLDEDIYPLNLSQQQKSDLVEFLTVGLTSDTYPDVSPPELPQ
jgi:cytochrome c peroxidase